MAIDQRDLMNWTHEAYKAGVAAVEASSDPGTGGTCGFAWVSVWPRNCSLARALKKAGWQSSEYYGVYEWVNDYGQSVNLKTIYARAYAAKLEELADSRGYLVPDNIGGMDVKRPSVTAGSRMD